MKYPLLTLSLIVLGCALLLTAELYGLRARRISLQQLQEAQAIRQGVLLSQLELANELTTYRQALGIAEPDGETGRAHVATLALPEWLGGGLSYGLPWTSRWKFGLADVDSLEICIAHDQIPATGLPLDESRIFKSKITDPDNSRTAGLLAFGGRDWDPGKPAQCVLNLRLDRYESTGVVSLNYLVFQNPDKLPLLETPAYISSSFSFPLEPDSWLRDPSLSGTARGLSGFQLESFEMPLLNQAYDYAEPLVLLRCRARDIREDATGVTAEKAASGLLIWIRKSVQ
jgi:hypothetical protein